MARSPVLFVYPSLWRQSFAHYLLAGSISLPVQARQGVYAQFCGPDTDGRAARWRAAMTPVPNSQSNFARALDSARAQSGPTPTPAIAPFNFRLCNCSPHGRSYIQPLAAAMTPPKRCADCASHSLGPMLLDDLWAAIARPHDRLCLHCIERRLGRPLYESDLLHCPANAGWRDFDPALWAAELGDDPAMADVHAWWAARYALGRCRLGHKPTARDHQ
jgi:hypothetical protein